jgi:hypothetical protein
MARHVLFPFVTITLALASLVSAEAPASAGAALFAGETFVVDPGHGIPMGANSTSAPSDRTASRSRS